MKILKFLRKHILLIIIILIIVGGASYYYSATHKKTSSQQLPTVVARRGNISVTVTGSGPVQPVKTANILSQASSKVLKVNFGEGDRVKAGDVLCVLDTTSLTNNIKNSQLQLEQAKLNLESAQKNYDSLVIRAPISGYITDLSVQKGSTVGANMVIATIKDTSALTVTAPFSEIVANSVKVGDKAYAELTDGSFTVQGVVSHIGASYAYKNGIKAKDITIKIANPGTLQLNSNMYIYLTTQNGKSYSLASGQLQVSNTTSVISQVAGTITTLNVSQGDYVKEGDVIAVLSSDNVINNLNQAKLQYEIALNNYNSQQDTVDNYTIKAPFDGLITSLLVNAGDVVKEGQQIATIADTSGMKITIPVDELDIANIKEGQKATITFDAISGKTYSGKVSKVAAEGTSQNGVTTYNVDISIDNPANVKIGMNANAEIEITNAENVVVLPQSAIIKLGGRNFVIEKKNIPANFDITKLASFLKQLSTSTSSGLQSARRTDGFAAFQSTGRNDTANNNTANNRFTGEYRRSSSNNSFRNLLTPVELGLSDNNMVEIKSGLDEGTEVVLPYAISSSSNSNSQSSQGQYNRDGGFRGGFMMGPAPGR